MIILAWLFDANQVGKHAGCYVGRIAIRARGTFSINVNGSVFDVSHKYCTLISRNDGYGYQLTKLKGGAIPLTTSVNGKLGCLADYREFK